MKKYKKYISICDVPPTPFALHNMLTWNQLATELQH